jgi:hypothetical protein
MAADVGWQVGLLSVGRGTLSGQRLARSTQNTPSSGLNPVAAVVQPLALLLWRLDM